MVDDGFVVEGECESSGGVGQKSTHYVIYACFLYVHSMAFNADVLGCPFGYESRQSFMGLYVPEQFGLGWCLY